LLCCQICFIARLHQIILISQTNLIMKMKDIDEILNASLKAIGKKSDRQLALAVGVTPQTISHYRKRISTPDNFAIVQLAKILGRSALEILGIIETEKAKTNKRREYWADFSERAARHHEEIKRNQRNHVRQIYSDDTPRRRATDDPVND